MEPVAVIPAKRTKLSINWKLCIFCQKPTPNPPSDGSVDGCEKVKDAYQIRVANNDTSNSINYLEEHIFNLIEYAPKWHKNCYSSFTSKVNIQRVVNRAETSRKNNPGPSSKIDHFDESRILTRTFVPNVDWKKCIYCQTRKKNEVTHQVMSQNTSDTIHKHASFSHPLKCRIGENDLIAYEAHYHSTCRREATRASASRSSDGSTGCIADDQEQSAFETLSNLLQMGLSNRNVYSMDDVMSTYSNLLAKSGIDKPIRSHHLKDKLIRHFGNTICFRRQRSMNQPQLIFGAISTGEAIEALKTATSKLEEVDTMKIGEPTPDKSFIISLNTVVTKIRADLQSTPGHIGYDNLTRENAEKCIPDSLYTLVRWIIQGADHELEENENSDKLDILHQQVLNVSQTISYAASQGRKNTPKHIGTGLYVHHATRSKHLVNYLHASGDSIGYDTVERITTSIAVNELERFSKNDNTFIPKNIIPERFVQFSADNLDLLEETLDGKGTFHVTQMAAFQRGPSPQCATETNSTIGRSRSLKVVPEEFHKLDKSETPVQQVAPRFFEPVKVDEMLKPSCVLVQQKDIDLAWILSRLENNELQKVPAWTGFNQSTSTVSVPVTTIGYMPIIQAPASQLDTILTVLLRCKKIAEKLGQQETVVTFDEALYCKAKELVWANPEQLNGVIVRLGGFHTAKNFLGVIGKHMDKSGLLDVLVEGDVFNENTAENILAGRSWNRAVRAHKLMFESLMRLLLKSFSNWQDSNAKESYKSISYDAAKLAATFGVHGPGSKEKRQNALLGLKQNLQEFSSDMKEYIEEKQSDPTFTFWKEYIDMVQLLLLFIRAEREGNWVLHLNTFKEMLPWMAIYDHTNYTRWGVIYLADMLELQQTAPNVYREFMAGNFVVKEANGSFNQVHTDMALEHINKLCKISGGIVGITRNKTALDKWMLSCCDLSRLAEDIRAVVGLSNETSQSQKELGSERMDRDEDDVNKLMEQLQEFSPFGRDTTELICISTNDVAPQEIRSDLCTAHQRGKDQLKRFVQDRIGNDATVNFRSTIQKNKSKTFASLNIIPETVKIRQLNTTKAARDLYRKLFSASASGRSIDIGRLLTHELADYPLSLTNDKGDLRQTDKAILSHIIADDYTFNVIPQTNEKSCVIIDAMALVQAIGKPTNCTTFGDLVDVFCKSVFNHFSGTCTRVDVIFDSYRMATIKAGTRDHRTSKGQKIRRIVDSRNIRLPSNWTNFINLVENKQNLIKFITKELMNKAEQLPAGRELVVGGGSETSDLVISSERSLMEHLHSTQEEADTRIILHALDASQNNYQRIVVYSKDTDVLLLLIYHQTAPEVWMHAGTSKKPRCIAVHAIRQSMSPQLIRNILAYHAITGSDSTSQFSGYGKLSTWQRYKADPAILDTFADNAESAMKDAEKFVIKIYSPTSSLLLINDLRTEMFHRIANPEKLPPTQDSLLLHLKRSQHQMTVWQQATVAKPNIKSPDQCGWRLTESGTMLPILMTLSVLPQVYPELHTCGCKTKKCHSSRCSCNKNQMACSLGCICMVNCQNPHNISLNDDESDDDD